MSISHPQNNRDGLAVKARGWIFKRQEDRKLLILLSDGKPYDVLVNRPNARNPKPYRDDYALHDTATEVRRLRQQGVSVLGVFVGEETELMAEQKIFGKDSRMRAISATFPIWWEAI